MESVKRAGKARSIGVSNFVPSQLESVLKTATIVPAINQVEFHPYLQHIAPTSLASDGTDFITFHRKHAIALSSYGPLTPATRAKGGPLDPVLDRLAAKYRAGVGQVLLRWSMDKGFITITTSSKEARLKGYLDSLRFSLDREDVEEISRVGKEKFFRGFWNHIYSADDRS
jgi:diketogulonate reductase-like aldo/keto reductase